MSTNLNGNDYFSDFGDIFDVDHFISSLKDDVHIVRELPEEYARMVAEGNYFGLPPVSWSNQTYYSNQVSNWLGITTFLFIITTQLEHVTAFPFLIIGFPFCRADLTSCSEVRSCATE